MHRPLDGRVALVTGAGRGLGQAYALELARLGAAVLVNDLGCDSSGRGADDSPARQTAEMIEAAGGRASYDDTDVASVAGGAKAVLATVGAFGRIDIVVNNAGFAAGGESVTDPDESIIDAHMGVHFKAMIGTISAASPDMAARGWGRIINVVSEVALDARFAGGLAYGAAKAAVWSATLTAARQLSPAGITVNAVSPGARTRLNDQLLETGFRGRAPSVLDLSPAHVARLVGYLAGPDAGDITGRVLHAAGGEIREYSTTRTSRSDLVTRLRDAIATPAPSF